jgi:hypothetical protein
VSAELDYLLSPRAIREQAARIHAAAEGGRTRFQIRPERLTDLAEFVLTVTRENYPDLKIPFHSRWGHFRAGGVDRAAQLSSRLGRDPAELARAKLDLAVVSVLLDAGAGMAWRYREGGREYSRSEGLAVASFHLLLSGAFSTDAKNPLRADARGLAELTPERLAEGFQVTASNPLVGVEGRTGLLRALAKAVANDPVHFPDGRPGGLYDWARAQGALEGPELLKAVLTGLGSIWPGRVRFEGKPLGDVWPYAPLGDTAKPEGMVPFHKLSQWMTYSLIEPLEEAGVRVSKLDQLTGLAEYRNGGLLLDRGLLTLRDPRDLERAHPPDSELVIEWRALTVHFLDRIAEKIRSALGLTPAEFPLARVLEGGTWWAGRKTAQALRADGGPPLKVISDGTVF